MRARVATLNTRHGCAATSAKAERMAIMSYELRSLTSQRDAASDTRAVSFSRSSAWIYEPPNNGIRPA